MMNISEEEEGDTSCFTNNGSPQGLMTNMYGISEDLVVTSASDDDTAHCTSLLYNLSILKDKFHHLQSLVSVLISPDHHPNPHQSHMIVQSQSQQSQPDSTTSSVVMANISTLVQEVIVTASSMMFTCQQMAMGDSTGVNRVANTIEGGRGGGGQGMSYSCDQSLDRWYGDNIYNNNSSNANDNFPQTISMNSNNTEAVVREEQAQAQTQARRKEVNGSLGKGILVNNCDIIELEASDLLAKYTHFCQVCGKGFKRDANLRMHMRAHGDEYKSTAALTNPMKKSRRNGNNNEEDHLLMKLPRKYSCPQEGCKWNKKHVKFQPLKSMICVKNHYKRSHCPKMYMCKRCSQKQFSVLSDLRTHEKHCGDLKWQCSCGTTFSRKDKLMGHVALFVGHTPSISSSTTMIMQG